MRARFRGWLAWWAAFVACSGDPSADNRVPTTTPARAAETGPPVVRAGPNPRVGNQDERGVKGQPDYDAAAHTLRERFMDRFRNEGVPDATVACRQMFEAADALYQRALEDLNQRKATAARLQTTRQADLTECVRETSPQAAMCATQLLSEGDGELPWALDQCTRAFPP